MLGQAQTQQGQHLQIFRDAEPSAGAASRNGCIVCGQYIHKFICHCIAGILELMADGAFNSLARQERGNCDLISGSIYLGNIAGGWKCQCYNPNATLAF